MTPDQLMDARRAIDRRIFQAIENGVALFFVTRREFYEVLMPTSGGREQFELGARKFWTLDVEVVDYELPVDVRMRYPQRTDLFQQRGWPYYR